MLSLLRISSIALDWVFILYKIAKSEIYQLTAKLGGIISGEHGIGLEKKPHIAKVVDSGALDYMRILKKTFDPKNILNPYKIFWCMFEINKKGTI